MANNWANVTNVTSMLGTANDATGGWFWIAMLFMVFVVSWVTMLPFGSTAAFLAAAFGSLVIGTLLAYIGLIGWSWIGMIVGAIIFAFIWIGYNND